MKLLSKTLIFLFTISALFLSACGKDGGEVTATTDGMWLLINQNSIEDNETIEETIDKAVASLSSHMKYYNNEESQRQWGYAYQLKYQEDSSLSFGLDNRSKDLYLVEGDKVYEQRIDVGGFKGVKLREKEKSEFIKFEHISGNQYSFFVLDLELHSQNGRTYMTTKKRGGSRTIVAMVKIEMSDIVRLEQEYDNKVSSLRSAFNDIAALEEYMKTLQERTQATSIYYEFDITDTEVVQDTLINLVTAARHDQVQEHFSSKVMLVQLLNAKPQVEASESWARSVTLRIAPNTQSSEVISLIKSVN